MERKRKNTLRHWRLQRLMTQRMLADQAGIDPSAVSYIERGARNPSRLTAERLSRALKVPVDDLFPALADDKVPA